MTIFDNINNGKYEQKVKFSSLMDRKSKSYSALTAFAQTLENMPALEGFAEKVMEVVHEELKEYQGAKDAQNAFHKQELALQHQFREDLEKDAGVENNPKKDALFSKTYDRGHSGGYHEVANIYLDLVELIQ